MNEIAGFFSLLVILAVIALAVAAIIMPVVVIFIDSKVTKIHRTLAAMEHMMRHGK
jgi:hypothetical protein